jgi:hypothetical protein
VGSSTEETLGERHDLENDLAKAHRLTQRPPADGLKAHNPYDRQPYSGSRLVDYRKKVGRTLYQLSARLYLAN